MVRGINRIGPGPAPLGGPEVDPLIDAVQETVGRTGGSGTIEGDVGGLRGDRGGERSQQDQQDTQLPKRVATVHRMLSPCSVFDSSRFRLEHETTPIQAVKSLLPSTF